MKLRAGAGKAGKAGWRGGRRCGGCSCPVELVYFVYFSILGCCCSITQYYRRSFLPYGAITCPSSAASVSDFEWRGPFMLVLVGGRSQDGQAGKGGEPGPARAREAPSSISAVCGLLLPQPPLITMFPRCQNFRLFSLLSLFFPTINNDDFGNTRARSTTNATSTIESSLFRKEQFICLDGSAFYSMRLNEARDAFFRPSFSISGSAFRRMPK